MKPLLEFLLRQGDNALVLGHRTSEWCGVGPALEEDIALANTALDLIGQAQLWLGYAAEVADDGRSADDLAYHRDTYDYRNLLMLEVPNEDFGRTILRQFLFDAFQVPWLTALCASSDPRAAEIAAKVDLPLDKVEITIDAMSQRQVSLDAPVSSGEDARTVLDTLIDTDERPLEELVSDESDARKLRGKLLSLASIEQDILRQRFGLDGATPRTLTEIGDQYDLSRERIRQLQQRALANLRRTLESSAA